MNDDLDISRMVLVGQLQAGTRPELLIARHPEYKEYIIKMFPICHRPTNNSYANRWTDTEEKFLCDNIGKISLGEIAQKLGRSERAIINLCALRGYTPALKQPDELTVNRIAQLLTVHSNAVYQWIDDSLLPGRRLPLKSGARVVKKGDFFKWVLNPMNWVYFEKTVRNTTLITCPHLRRLVELKKERWGDEWWTTVDAARWHGLNDNAIYMRIMAGKYPPGAVINKYGQWRILKSVVIGEKQNRFSDESDAFLVLAFAVGLSGRNVDKLMGFAETTAVKRLKTLRQNKKVSRLIEQFDLRVQYIDGNLFADWRLWTHRFPTVARAMSKFSQGIFLNHTEHSCVRQMLRTWIHHYLKDDRLARQIDRASHGGLDALKGYYQKLIDAGFDPVAPV